MKYVILLSENHWDGACTQLQSERRTLFHLKPTWWQWTWFFGKLLPTKNIGTNVCINAASGLASFFEVLMISEGVLPFRPNWLFESVLLS